MAKKSKYAAKRASGQMMYGPGCCAHDRVITEADRIRFAAMRYENERFRHPGAQGREA